MKSPTLLALLSAALFLPLPLLASDGCAIKTSLNATGDPDATGLVSASLKLKKSELTVTAAKLDPSKTFDVEVAGIIEGTLTTDKNGKGRVRFVTPAAKGTQLLDFDPRGQTLRILDGGNSVLEGVISGNGERGGAVIDEKAQLSPENAPAKSKASARYTVTAKDRRTLRVEASNLTGGPFRVLVAGIDRGELTLRGKNGLALFDSAPQRAGVVLLDFDPRGAMVDIVSGATVIFSGKLQAKAKGVNTASPSETGVFLASTGLDNDGTARARLRIDSRARKHFSVELEDVNVGSYDLLVDGAVVGSITVAMVTGGTEGEIEFTNGDDDPSELPLTFDPVGKTLAVMQGTAKYFESVFTPNTTGAGTPGTEPDSTLDELLSSTGLDADAKAEAKYEVKDGNRHKFSVEVEDVPVGSYTLTIGGVVRGTISVRLDPGTGKTEGELEFDSKVEPGHKPLTFDPRGQTIEISDASGVFFTHLFGSGSSAGGGGNVAPFDVTVALISTGEDSNASAEAEYKRDLDGTLSFEVELEDLAVGSYDLLVGGIVRGAISVVTDNNGTRGKLEFESEQKPGQPLLNFEVAGQEIVIQQGATVFFTRTFPTP